MSAKLGIGVKDVLECVVKEIPAPTGDADKPLKALIFDSIYDSYKGVIVYVRVFEGTVKPGDTIRLMSTGAEFQLVEVGHMGATSLTPCDKLEAGEVGYLTASIKTVRDTRVGDTVTLAANPTAEPLPGFRTVTPMVFCGIYPADRRRLPRPEGRPGKAAAQRCFAELRTGNQRRPGLRLPLRIPGTPAHGDHHRTSGTGV